MSDISDFSNRVLSYTLFSRLTKVLHISLSIVRAENRTQNCGSTYPEANGAVAYFATDTHQPALVAACATLQGALRLCGTDHHMLYRSSYVVQSTICCTDHHMWYRAPYVLQTTICGVCHHMWYRPPNVTFESLRKYVCYV